jgi:hypothetical protein
MTRETLQYIKSLDERSDTRMLRDKLGLREQCLRTFRVANMLLKRGAAAGLTLFEIASIAARQDMDLPSRLEQLVESAMLSAQDLQKQRRQPVAPSPSPLLVPVAESASPAADGEAEDGLSESVMKRSRSVTTISKMNSSPTLTSGVLNKADSISSGLRSDRASQAGDLPLSLAHPPLRRDQSEASLRLLSDPDLKSSTRQLTEAFLRALSTMLDQTFESVIRGRKPEPMPPPPPEELESSGRQRSFSSSSSPTFGAETTEEKTLPRSLRDSFPTPSMSPVRRSMCISVARA